MKKILEGVVHFKHHEYEAYRDLFADLGERQGPSTLFIGCSDSRVIPSMITHTPPGELFVIRNVANMVPAYEIAGEHRSTSSAIEYAARVLKVRNFIVCGHSNCGGCALINHEDPDSLNLPITKTWMDLAGPVKDAVNRELRDRDDVDPAARAWFTERTNVVEQMNNLLTYPYIRERYEAGTINLRGWYYVIPTGEVYEYTLDRGEFIRIDE